MPWNGVDLDGTLAQHEGRNGTNRIGEGGFMSVGCTIYGLSSKAPSTGICHFEVQDGRVVGTCAPGYEIMLHDLLAADPLKAMPGVRVPQSDPEAWIKALPWYYSGCGMISAIMDDGSTPPMPVTPSVVKAAEQAMETEMQKRSRTAGHGPFAGSRRKRMPKSTDSTEQPTPAKPIDLPSNFRDVTKTGTHEMFVGAERPKKD
jgi:hypothetical protein